MQVAIDQALTVLNWQENLPSKEMPPEWMWEDSAGISDWFKSLRDSRDEPQAERWKSAESGDGDDDDAGAGSSKPGSSKVGPKEAGMVSNDLARMLRQ